MAFSSPASSRMSSVPNVTPLIDVLLVLLIIFMVVLPAAPHGLDSQIPARSPSPVLTTQATPFVLEVLPARQATGRVRYRLSGRDLAPGELRAALLHAEGSVAKATLFIEGDSALEFGPIASAVSEAKQAGFATVGLLPQSEHATR